jgi:hypothetical protein
MSNFTDAVERVAQKLDIPKKFVAEVLTDHGYDELPEEIDLLAAEEAVRYALAARKLLVTDED